VTRFGPDRPQDAKTATSPSLAPDAEAVTEEQVGELVRAMCESMEEFLKAHEVTQEVLEMKISI